MTQKKGFGSNKHTPPPVTRTQGALDTAAPQQPKIKKIDSTVVMSVRTTPETRETVRRLSYENKLPIGELIEQAVSQFDNSLTPQKKSPL